MKLSHDTNPLRERAVDIVTMTLLGVLAAYIAVDTTINSDSPEPQPVITQPLEQK